jgi:hypothetical protein
VPNPAMVNARREERRGGWERQAEPEDHRCKGDGAERKNDVNSANPSTQFSDNRKKCFFWYVLCEAAPYAE